MATGFVDTVAVWQWQSDDNRWNSYLPKVSNSLESARVRGAKKVNLRTIDPALDYTVDLDFMMQHKQMAGADRLYSFGRKVRRVTVPGTSSFANGVIWEWKNDLGQWNSYDHTAADYLEDEYMKRTQLVDLRHTTLGLPYLVNFEYMIQTNINTGTNREIQRRRLHDRYCNTADQVFSGVATGARHDNPPTASRLNSEFGGANRSNQDVGKRIGILPMDTSPAWSTPVTSSGASVPSGNKGLGTVSGSHASSTPVSQASSGSVTSASTSNTGALHPSSASTSPAATGGGDADYKEKVTCKVCKANDCEMACIPCFHVALCIACTGKLRDRKCPMCRQPVKEFKKVYF